MSHAPAKKDSQEEKGHGEHTSRETHAPTTSSKTPAVSGGIIFLIVVLLVIGWLSSQSFTSSDQPLLGATPETAIVLPCGTDPTSSYTIEELGVDRKKLKTIYFRLESGCEGPIIDKPAGVGVPGSRWVFDMKPVKQVMPDGTFQKGGSYEVRFFPNGVAGKWQRVTGISVPKAPTKNAGRQLRGSDSFDVIIETVLWK